MRVAADQKRFWSPKPGEDCDKNRFGAPNPARIAPKTDLEPQTRRGLRQKPIWSPKPGEDCIKNRFGACGEGHFTVPV